MKRIPLKYLAKRPLTNGLGLAGAYDNPSWPRYVRTTDIADERTLRSDVFASQPPSVAAGALLEPRDILMTAAGTIGKSYLHYASEPACYAGFLVRFSPRDDVDERFISYWMQSADYWAQIEQGAVRSTINNFSAGKYRVLSAPYPTLDMQRRVADFLDDQCTRIDSIMALREEQIAALNEHRRCFLEERMRPAGPEQRLKTVLARRPEYGANAAAEFTESTWPRFIRTTDVTPDGDLRDETFRSLPPAIAAPYILEDGDILFTRSGATVGKSFVYRASWGTAAFAGYLIRVRVKREQALPEWVRYFCETPYYWSQISESSIQATIQNVNAEKYASLRLPLPAVDVQRRLLVEFDGTLRANREGRDAMREQVDLLRERKQSLITAAVTGEFDVTTAGGRGVVA